MVYNSGHLLHTNQLVTLTVIEVSYSCMPAQKMYFGFIYLLRRCVFYSPERKYKAPLLNKCYEIVLLLAKITYFKSQ